MILAIYMRILSFLMWWIKALFQLLYNLDYALYKLWLLIYGEPDKVDAIIFNELPQKSQVVQTQTGCQKRKLEKCCVNRIVSYINRAKVSIDIAHMTISHARLFGAISSAQERGVQIRLVTDSQMIVAPGSLVQHMVAIGILVRCSPLHGMMHHKLCIIDGEQRILQMDRAEGRARSRLWRRKGYLMTGSLNWTKMGTYGNYENVVVTSNRKVNASYQTIFDDMWSSFQELNLASFRLSTRLDHNGAKPICVPWRIR